jgi:hypothetical protein
MKRSPATVVAEQIVAPLTAVLRSVRLGDANRPAIVPPVEALIRADVKMINHNALRSLGSFAVPYRWIAEQVDHALER